MMVCPQGFISSAFHCNNVSLISTMTPPSIFNRTPGPSRYYSKFTYCQSLPKLASCRGVPLMKSTCQTTKVAVSTLPHAVSSQSNYVTNAVSCPSATTLSKEDGIGIVKFLKGKSFLVTGATGLLGKVLIEKMLRTSPEIGKIYVLMKATNEEHATHRVRSEIIECELFEKVKQIHGSNYYDFMTSKLHPVVGDIGEDDLGIDSELSNRITQQVDVIISSAANTTFDERYDVALNINTKGPFRLLSFAKKCSNLQLLLHVSTAYVNGDRKGVVMEKPFNMGDSIAAEMLLSETLPKLDADDEIKLASDLAKHLDENETPQRMKELGLMRARKYGWPDVYTLSKAMGEMMLSKYREQVPLVIVRPSIIESTYREPFPGWIEGNRMLDPIILSYGKGILPGYIGDLNGIVDVVPVDVVVNMMLSAMAKHATETTSSSLDHDDNIYHVSSSVENPIITRDLFNYSLDHFRSYPIINSTRMKEVHQLREFKLFDSLDDFSTFMYKEIKDRIGLKDSEAISNPTKFCKLEKKCKRILNNLMQMATLHAPYAFYKGRFDNSNSKRLMEEMSIQEQKEFPVDLKSIDWQHYFSNIHAPALTKHFKM